MNARVDVLRVLDDCAATMADGSEAGRLAWIRVNESRAVVVALIEAATRANGDHSAPHDCYATGPLTGDDYLDLVSCPGCELAAALSRIGAD